MDDYNKKVGNAIRQLRKKRKMSQINLCNQGSKNELCTVRHLQRIEAGEVSPTAAMLNRLLSRLGASYAEFEQLAGDLDMLAFRRDFSELWDAGFERRLEEESRLLENLKAKPYCNPANPLIRQLILLCEGSKFNNFLPFLISDFVARGREIFQG